MRERVPYGATPVVVSFTGGFDDDEEVEAVIGCDKVALTGVLWSRSGTGPDGADLIFSAR